MRCLVTGGAGFVGSHLVDALAQRGDEVVVLDNFSSGCRDNLAAAEGIRIVEGDLLDFETTSSVARGMDVIFHLAAEVGTVKSLEDPRLDASVNVLGTVNVLRSALDCGAKKVVYSSSAAIFGDAKTLPIDESQPSNPESFYALSKFAAERYCMLFAQLFKLETVCLRFFNVYGPRQGYSPYASVVRTFIERLSRGLPPVIYGDGEQTRDFVSVHDVVAASLLAADSDFPSEVFNVGSGTRTSVNTLAEIVQRAMSTSFVAVHAPSRQGEVRDSAADVSKARRLLGYQPAVSLESGIRELVSALGCAPAGGFI